MKIVKIMKTSSMHNLDNMYLVSIPEDYKKDYTYHAMKAIQKITNDHNYCGTCLYDPTFDGKIPEGKKIYTYSELCEN